jgi:hypothetical protein
VTLLFPFVAIRALGLEKESGALRLLIAEELIAIIDPKTRTIVAVGVTIKLALALGG